MKPFLLSILKPTDFNGFFRVCLFFIFLQINFQSKSNAQCSGGYTAAQLNWDVLDHYYNSGVNLAPYGFTAGNYISNAWEQTQRFAIGSNYLTLAVSATGVVRGENNSHTGNLANFTGDDAQFTPSVNGQTIIITFNNEVMNASFTLYDIDASGRIDFGAVNTLAIPQNINVVIQASTILTIFNNNLPNAFVTSNATALANTSNQGSATITVAGPVKAITITLTTIGSDPVIWLSDINACVTGSFPTNYNRTGENQPMTGPAGNQPDYILTTPDNNSAYMVDPATGQCRWLFTDASNTYINSFGYDPYNKHLYYISESASANANNKTLKRYDFNTETSSTLIADVGTTLSIPTFNQGIQSAGAAFYDGALYFGVEGGRFGTGTSTVTRETMVWRINFDASFNPTVAYQVYATNAYTNATNTSLHDWGDYVIKNGVLYNFNTARNGTNYSQSKYHHLDLMTAAETVYNNPGTTVYNGQAAMTWANGLYYLRNIIDLYNENGTNAGAPQTLTVVGGGPGWVGNAGDASENFRPKCDFGDAPASYDSDPISPAVHERFDSLRLGLTWDREWIKNTSTDATLDGSDEDGLPFVPTLDTATTNFVIDVDVYNNSGSNATLGAWLDINGNGIFDASEYSSAVVTSSASMQVITLSWIGINTPLVIGQSTFLRLRITSASKAMGAANATGYYDVGEVEDYRVYINNVLPVDLISFEAKAIKNKQVKLTWETENEVNTGFYEVEKSTDGFNWIKTGSVAANNKIKRQTYSFYDYSPFSGKSFYRLKITNTGNGASEKYSNTRTVFISDYILRVDLFPNPAKSQTVLEISSDHAQKAQYKIIDMQGKVVQEKTIQLSSGKNSILVNGLDNFSPGIYNIRIESEQQHYNKKLIIKQ